MVYYASHSVHCKFNTISHTVNTVNCTLYIAQCTLYIVQVHYTSHSIHCKLYNKRNLHDEKIYKFKRFLKEGEGVNPKAYIYFFNIFFLQR